MKREIIILGVLLLVLTLPTIFALENNATCVKEGESIRFRSNDKCCEGLVHLYHRLCETCKYSDDGICTSDCMKYCSKSVIKDSYDCEICMVGSDRDSHGCIGSAGYSWCEEKQKCLRSWDENCTKEIDNSFPGQNKVKILPETASERARERLGELGFTVTLKEVGQNKTVYIAKAQKEGKLFGFMKVRADVSAEIDAETGEVIKIHKPWWGFLAGI